MTPASCIVVSEVAQAHDGSLGTAHAYIDAIAEAGADAVKFQTHIAAAESTPSEPWRVRFSKQDATRYDYWRRMEFTPDQWVGLKQHADERGLMFLSSPFSLEAVELLDRVGVAAWKIASGEVGNGPLFDRIAQTGLPVWVSTGMSDWSEIDTAVARVRQANLDLTLLQCTTQYPCPAEQVGLNVLDEFKTRYACEVGLSDHSGTIYPGLAAAALGASIVEVHVTLSRAAFGPDVVASVTTDELRQLTDGVRAISTMLRNPVDKNAAARNVAAVRQLFTKSVVARQTLEPGTVLQPDHLIAKKPGTGIAADLLPTLVGRRVRRRIERDELLAEDDLEVIDA